MSRGDSGFNGLAAGSLSSNEPVFLAVGKLRRPHGVSGEIAMEIYTDFPERLKPGKKLFLGDEHIPVRLQSVRMHNQLILIHLEGYKTREEVGTLRNQVVYVPTSNLPLLDEGEYYHHQLIGLMVFDESGRSLGKIAEILETGANDVFIIRSKDRGDLLLPYLEELVIRIDLDLGQFHTRLIPGLLQE